MDKETEKNNKLNALVWAKKEYQNDKDYWQDRSKHANGLLKEVANFVIQAGQRGTEEGGEQ